MTPDNQPPPVPDELVAAFNELAARAEAGQRLALVAIEMLAQERVRDLRPWDLIAEADRLDGAATLMDPISGRSRIIAAGLLRFLGDALEADKPRG